MHPDTDTAALPWVLYVEDHPINALLMQTLFERRSELRLVLAECGTDALHLQWRTPPVLLLVDLRLPDCHGSQLLERLRAVHGWHDMPAVAVTAESDFDIRGTTFCELWPKPMNLQQVLKRIEILTDRNHGPSQGSAGSAEQPHLTTRAPQPQRPQSLGLRASLA